MLTKDSYIEKYLKRKKLFDNKNIEEALTHKSANKKHYEKLEFLGDSVLGLCVTDFLYAKFDTLDVGEISKIKGYLVSKEVLYIVGTENNLIRYLKFGSALKKKDLKNNKKIISDVVESLIGAIYLINGYDEAEKFINGIYKKEFKNVKSKRDFGDYKSALQMRLLAIGNSLPEYKVTKTEGKEHKKVFYVDVVYAKNIIGKGKGKTIKEAEQIAAKKALGKAKIKEEQK